MRLDGFHSWRLAVSGAGDLAFLALYLREAAGLTPPTDDATPPPLLVAPPDRREVLTDAEREHASAAWPGWWRDVLGYEARVQGPPDDAGDFTDWVGFNASERAAIVGEPPDFAALSDRPSLQKAARSLFEEVRVAHHAEGPGGAAREPQVLWPIVQETAEAVARRRRVPVGEVHGVVVALPVQGVWWRPADPGEVVCSAAALADEAAAARLIRDAFEGGLPR